VELFYRKIGQGRPLIFIHGLLGSSDNWISIAKYLSADFEVFMPDMRNHGRSFHADIMNYHAMAEDIYEFVQYHDIQNPIICGHSMGGKVAMQFVLNYPEVSKKMFVVDMGIKKYPLRYVPFFSKLKELNFDNFQNRKDLEIYLKFILNDDKLVQLALKNIERKTSHRFGWRINIEALYNNIDNILDAIEVLDGFNGKVVFIKGQKSDYILDEDIDAIKKVFVNLSLETIPNAGHWVHIEQPLDFISCIKKYL